MDQQTGYKLDNGQYFHLEHHLLHQIIILLETVGNAVDGFTEKEPWHNARHQPLHISEPFNGRRGFKAHSEYDRIDADCHDRLYEHPHHPKVRAHKAFPEISLAQIPYKLPFSYNLFHQRKHIIHISKFLFIRT